MLNDQHYREKFSVANPNTKLIDALEAASVKLVVCGQSLAHNNFPQGWVNSKVEVTLSAISDVVILEQQGYVFVPM